MTGMSTDAALRGHGIRSRVPTHAVVEPRASAAWRVSAGLAAFIGMLLLVTSPAWALPQRGHVFSFAVGSKGSGEAEFSDPVGVAVSDGTGLVYVADRKNRRVEIFKPAINEDGTLTGEAFAGQTEVTGPSAIAVDNSGLGIDSSAGDVYVVGGSARKVIYKLSAEGALLGEISRFEEGGAKQKLEPIDGLAVNAEGELLVYQEDGVLDSFNDAAENQHVSRLQTALSKGEPGFAVDSTGALYVGTEGEGKVPVIAKLEGGTGAMLTAELDGEDTDAVAVNPIDTAGNLVDEQDDVYLTNEQRADGLMTSQITELAPGGSLIQHLQAAGLQEANGIALDAHTGSVFVTDAAANDLDVFQLEPAAQPQVAIRSKAVPPTPPHTNDTRLIAQVNPTGAPTRYYFEYGTSNCAILDGCSNSVPASAGEGFGDEEETIDLADLPPAEYHYRLVAENSHGTTISAERTFTVLSIFAGLPDGRAWELVSPVNKHGAAIEPLTYAGAVFLASESGNALTYVSDGAITENPQGNRSPEPQQNISTRSPTGWTTEDIATPNSIAQGVNVGNAPEYQSFTPDLSMALVAPWTDTPKAEPPLAPGVQQATIYLRDDTPLKPGPPEQKAYAEVEANNGFLAPGYLPLVTELNVAPGAKFGSQLSFVSATPDLSHVILKSNVALTAAPSGAGLYEWKDGVLEFVSLLPTGEPASKPRLGFREGAVARAISSDGSRVIWTNTEENAERGHLYMRDIATRETIQLDSPEDGVEAPSGVGVAQFQTASTDGSRVFFTDKQRLTADSTAEPGAENAGKADLYECEMVEIAGKLTCELSDLTVDHLAGEHADVQGLLFGGSEDGASVYLVATGVLASNANNSAQVAEPGGDNLYALHQTSGQWTTRFIATLSGEDSQEWEGDEGLGNTAYLTARVSPNGRYLAFMSDAALTGYDNVDRNGGQPDEEVYLYDANAEGLTCVSCDPSGAPPTGVFDTAESGEGSGLVVDRRRIWRGRWLAGNIPGWTAQSVTSALFQSRYLSNEGRLFFDSADALVPQVAATTRREEVNGATLNVGVENVYEYEPARAGSCHSASGGCISLISSGTSPRESAFLEATPNGNDVFFLTEARLSEQDADTAFDIYDARICTEASPCLSAPPPAPEGCVGAEACRGGETIQEPLAPGGSATFAGPGNLLVQPPAKQDVKDTKSSSNPLTRAQRLAKALQACRKSHTHSGKKRKTCEAQAYKRYGPKKKKATPRAAAKKSSVADHSTERR